MADPHIGPQGGAGSRQGAQTQPLTNEDALSECRLGGIGEADADHGVLRPPANRVQENKPARLL